MLIVIAFLQFKKSNAYSPNILPDIFCAYINTCVYMIHTLVNFASLFNISSIYFPSQYP